MIEVDETQKGPNLAYHDGIRDFENGKSLKDCPETEWNMANAWRRGWEMANNREYCNDYPLFCVQNDLIGKYAVVLDSDQSPWEIVEFKIEQQLNHRKFKNNQFPLDELIIWVRGVDTIWFRSDQCYVESKEECEVYIEVMQERKERKRMDDLLTPLTIVV